MCLFLVLGVIIVFLVFIFRVGYNDKLGVKK